MGSMTNPSHPGEVLAELYLKPLGMSATDLAGHLDVPRAHIQGLLSRQSSVTADTAMRLARFFSTTPELWINMQRDWNLAQIRKSIDVSSIVPLRTNRESGRSADRLEEGPHASA